MKRLFILLSALISNNVNAVSFAVSPESLVNQFIVDYRQWNDKAVQLDSKRPNGEGVKQAEIEYSKLLKKYCLPGFKGQQISFGSESTHQPELEKIVSNTTSKVKAIVKTQAKSNEVDSFIADYEYHLIYKSERWYLEEVFYMDSEGKYESL